MTFHDVIPETLPHLVFRTRRSRLFWRMKCRLAVRRASLVLTVSEASKQGLMRRFRLAENYLRVVPEAAAASFGPVDRCSDVTRAVLAGHNVRPGKRYLLYVGGISPHKNLSTLIEGFARVIIDPVYRDVRLLLIGEYATDVFHTQKRHLQILT